MCKVELRASAMPDSGMRMPWWRQKLAAARTSAAAAPWQPRTGCAAAAAQSRPIYIDASAGKMMGLY
eukprot:3719663-Pleurochrysis_carterae.AAC.1